MVFCYQFQVFVLIYGKGFVCLIVYVYIFIYVGNTCVVVTGSCFDLL